MLINNAISFVINSSQFAQKVQQANLNINACRRLDTKLLADVASETYYFELYFDFGNAGQSTNDILARVKILTDGSFQFLYFE
jgi:hypothetical protein